jgi:hypothetical protein
VIVTRSLVLLTLAAVMVQPIAAAACEALTKDGATNDAFEKCLSSRPLFTTSIGGSLAIGDSGARGGLFVTLEIPVMRPLWISARSKMGSSYSDVDLLAGWVLRSSYGAGTQSWTMMSNTYHSPTAYGYSYTTRTSIASAQVIQRSALVLLGGVKGVSRTIDGEMERSVDIGKTFLAGISLQHANHVGSHSRLEAFGVMRDGKFGGVLTWHNSVPTIGRWVVGMEVGFVPVLGANDTTTHTFYWNIVDLGISYEL